MKSVLCSGPFCHLLVVLAASLGCAVAAAEPRVLEKGNSETGSLIRHVVIEAATAETPRSDTASITELSAQEHARGNLGRAIHLHDTSANPFLLPRSGMEVGDPFPVYWDGVWHLYALRRDLRSVLHFTSTDLVKWSEHEPAMVGKGIATGTVVRHENTFYMFYTDAGPQTIRLVVSDNPWHFDFTRSRLVAEADEKVYQLHRKKCRDCYVFYNGEERLWWMLVEATSDNAVAVGLFKSKDLLTWTQHDPIFKDKARKHASCPQVFKRDGRWYLTCLDYPTWYYFTDGLYGPWSLGGHYHTKRLTAASRWADDGKRQLAWGFFTKHSTPEQDNRGYGGPLGVGREMVLTADRAIGVRPIPELVAAIRKPKNNADLFDRAKERSGKWELDSEKKVIKCTDDSGGVVLLDLQEKNSNYYLEVEITLSRPEASAAVVVRCSRDFDDGYRAELKPAERKIAIRQFASDGGTFDQREHAFADGTATRLQVFVCDVQIEAFVDGQASLSTRVLNPSGHRVAIEITGGLATISKPLLHYFDHEKDKQLLSKREESEEYMSTMANRGGFGEAAAACVGVAVSGSVVPIFVTACLLSGLLSSPSYAGEARDTVLLDYPKIPHPEGWKIDGYAFGTRSPNLKERQKAAKSSRNQRQYQLGTMTSPEFVIDRDYMEVVCSGVFHPTLCTVRLIVDGKVVRSCSPEAGAGFLGQGQRATKYWFDLRTLKGKTATIEVRDGHANGYLDLVTIVATDRKPPTETKPIATVASWLPDHYQASIKGDYLLLPVGPLAGTPLQEVAVEIDGQEKLRVDLPLAFGSVPIAGHLPVYDLTSYQGKPLKVSFHSYDWTFANSC